MRLTGHQDFTARLPLWRCAATAVVLCLAAQVAPLVAQQPPRAVIVDTDAGPDDLVALAYLLARPDVRVEAVTIAYGVARQAAGARNVLRLLAFAGRTEVPVYLGRETPAGPHHVYPDAWRDASDTIPGLTLPAARRAPERRSAVDFLADRLRDGSRPVDLLMLGAHTNIAEALDRPQPVRALRSLVVMGGSLDAPGNVNDDRNTMAEWNLYADPPAAQRVLESGLPLLLVPLDATSAVPVNAAMLAEIRRRATTPLGRVAADVLTAASDPVESETYYMWDPLAAVALTDRAVVRVTRVPVIVRVDRPEEGRLLRDRRGTPLDVALTADPRRFLDAFLRAFVPR